MVTVLCVLNGLTFDGVISSPLVASLECDLCCATYGETEDHQEADVNGHKVVFDVLPLCETSALRNALLENVHEGYLFFADIRDSLVTGYAQRIEDAFVKYPRAAGIAFGCLEDKRLKVKQAREHGIKGAAFPIAAIKSKGITFLRDGVKEIDSACCDCFLFDNACWPSTLMGLKEEVIVSKQIEQETDLSRDAYYYSHAYGILWWLFYWLKNHSYKKEQNMKFRPFWGMGYRGHRDYLRRGIPLDEGKGSTLAFVISIISLVGLATQAILSLVVTFTETQYIPIWVSLIFLVVFAVAYAFSMPKVRPLRNVIIVTAAVAVASIIGCMIPLLCLGVNVYLSIFGAFLVTCLVIGITYCFMPSAADLAKARAKQNEKENA